MRVRALALLAGLLVTRSLAAADWPQWRGPQLDGTSAEKNLPLRWGLQENVAWKLALPAVGGSSPIVWGDRVFLLVSHDPASDESIELWAVARGDGQVLWKRRVSGGNVKSRKHDMASPSPVTDGKHVWALTGTGVIKAFACDGTSVDRHRTGNSPVRLRRWEGNPCVR